MSQKHQIFISSVQKEFAVERQAIKTYIQGDPLLRQFFNVFLFEDIPAGGQPADPVYLRAVDCSSIYVGLLGKDYGFEGLDGISATEYEFNRATLRHCERLIFIKGSEEVARHPKILKLIKIVGTQLIRRRFNTVPELIASFIRKFNRVFRANS